LTAAHDGMSAQQPQMGVAVVTGASRGIGAATARRLAADGYQVLGVARSSGDLAAMAAGVSGITTLTADVGDDSSAEHIVAAAGSMGRLEVWVNNAATIEQAPFAKLDYGRWRETLRVDLDGVFLGCSAAFRYMAARGGGVIVNIASLSGVAAVEKFPGNAAYNVAKAGVIALSEAVALEGKPHGVRCVCLSPGAVDTDLLRRAAPQLRPGVTADDVAAIIAFLVTPAAAPLSGTNIPIFSNE
jgi:NAD(P)-dependent dehydrogenase (short-subunit alcohol dehydrogenase family)